MANKHVFLTAKRQKPHEQPISWYRTSPTNPLTRDPGSATPILRLEKLWGAFTVKLFREQTEPILVNPMNTCKGPWYGGEFFPVYGTWKETWAHERIKNICSSFVDLDGGLYTWEFEPRGELWRRIWCSDRKFSNLHLELNKSENTNLCKLWFYEAQIR